MNKDKGDWWFQEQKKLERKNKEDVFKKNLRNDFHRPPSKLTIRRFFDHIKNNENGLSYLIMFLDVVKAKNQLRVFRKCKAQRDRELKRAGDKVVLRGGG